MKTNKQRIAQITGIGLLTAIVIVLQLLGSFIHVGIFSISLVLLPIVVGAGAWLGCAFGITVLLSGDAALFLAINIPGTIITVLAKGILAGLLAGLTYQAVAKKNRVLATICAAVVCPVVNTGVFLAGCAVFFMDTMRLWANGGNVVAFMIVGLVGVNFLAELAINLVFSPTVVHLINIGKKQFARNR